jgi:transposase
MEKQPRRWRPYTDAKEHERELLPLLSHKLCQGVSGPLHTFGRPPIPLADVLFAMVLKVYNRISCRNVRPDLELAHHNGLLSRIPSRNTIHNYFESKEVTKYLLQLIVESSLPLREIETVFAIDSTGFSSSTKERWVDHRYGRSEVRDKRVWIKVHLMCGVKTNIVTAVAVSDANKADSPYFKPLFKATARNFRIRRIIGDKAYSALKNMLLAWENKSLPIIPFKCNAKAEHASKDALWTRLYHFYSLNAEWFDKSYHLRSNAESTFSMIKRLFEDYVLSRTKTAMVNEVLCKILCHNLCVLIRCMYELEIEPEFWQDGQKISRAS